MPDAQAEPSTDATPERAGSLADRLATEVGALENELREIEMLVGQARTEAERHETKRAQVADKLTQGTNLPTEDVTALSAQLVTLTRRASVMESQVEVDRKSVV